MEKENSKKILGGEHIKQTKLATGEYVTIFAMELEEGQKIDKATQVEAFKRYEELEKFRGWLISETNTIEKFIELVLTNSLFPKEDKIRRNLFNEFILSQRFFTLWEKRSLLRGILKSELLLERLTIDRQTLKEFRTKFQELIERRNEFGHNPILIKVPSLVPIMRCTKNGKENDVELTAELLDKIKQIQKDVLSTTMELNKQINESS